MVINTDKTKCLVSSKEPTRCKLEMDQKIVEQVNQFIYLGAEITSYGNLQNEVREQTMKAFRISGYLRDIVWKNKYLNINSKIRVYKSTIRPVITYHPQEAKGARREPASHPRRAIWIPEDTINGTASP